MLKPELGQCKMTLHLHRAVIRHVLILPIRIDTGVYGYLWIHAKTGVSTYKESIYKCRHILGTDVVNIPIHISTACLG